VTRRVTFALLAILLLGAALRLVYLRSVPPGFQFDEAYNALDAAHVLELGLSSRGFDTPSATQPKRRIETDVA
jgi:hypothetical protein